MQAEQIKINWHPVLVPTSVRVLALELNERSDFGSSGKIKQYRHNDTWLAVAAGSDDLSEEFAETDIACHEFPMLVSSLISDAFLGHFQALSWRIAHRKGESFAYRVKQTDTLPPTITLYEGLRIKSYSIPHEQSTAFGLFIDYASSQEFTQSLADDKSQMDLAKQGSVLVGKDSDGLRISGLLSSVQQNQALLMWHGKQHTMPLTDLKLQANYETIQAYVDKTKGSGRGRSVVKQLLTHSLTLTPDGYRNLNQLSARYRLVSEMLGRERNANLNIRLNTACQALASVATEPASLEVRL